MSPKTEGRKIKTGYTRQPSDPTTTDNRARNIARWAQTLAAAIPILRQQASDWAEGFNATTGGQTPGGTTTASDNRVFAPATAGMLDHDDDGNQRHLPNVEGHGLADACTTAAQRTRRLAPPRLTPHCPRPQVPAPGTPRRRNARPPRRSPLQRRRRLPSLRNLGRRHRHRRRQRHRHPTPPRPLPRLLRPLAPRRQTRHHHMGRRRMAPPRTLPTTRMSPRNWRRQNRRSTNRTRECAYTPR